MGREPATGRHQGSGSQEARARRLRQTSGAPHGRCAAAPPVPTRGDAADLQKPRSGHAAADRPTAVTREGLVVRLRRDAPRGPRASRVKAEGVRGCPSDTLDDDAALNPRVAQGRSRALLRTLSTAPRERWGKASRRGGRSGPRRRGLDGRVGPRRPEPGADRAAAPPLRPRGGRRSTSPLGAWATASAWDRLLSRWRPPSHSAGPRN